MSLDALCRFFHIKADYRIAPPQPRNPIITAANLAEAYLQMYDPRRDSETLKTHPEQDVYKRQQPHTQSASTILANYGDSIETFQEDKLLKEYMNLSLIHIFKFLLFDFIWSIPTTFASFSTIEFYVSKIIATLVLLIP